MGQLLVAAVGPIALGLGSGAVIGSSGAIFLSLQVIAIVGGFWAGLEHASLGAGAARGALGGLLFGVAVLVGYGLFAGPDRGLLPELRPLQIVITTSCGTALGVAGARLRQHWTESGFGERSVS
jgi:hypothetical protein